LLANPFAALFIDTGLGKTIIVLTLLMQLYLQEKFNRCLVVAPIRVAAQGWPNEIARVAAHRVLQLLCDPRRGR